MSLTYYLFLVVLLAAVHSDAKKWHHNAYSNQYMLHRRNGITQDDSAKRASLPNLNVLINGKENGVEFEIAGCKVKLTIDGECKFKLSPSPDSCGGKLPLAGILNHFLPNNKLGEKSNTFILPDKFDLEALQIDKCKSTIEFKTTSREKLDLIPGKLSMEGVSLKMKLNYKSGVVDWELLDLDISASVTIGEKKIPITAKKKEKETSISFSFKTDDLKIPSLTGMFSKKEVSPPDSDEQVSSKVMGLTIKKPSVSGVYDTKGFFEIVASGEPDSAAFKSASFFIIIQKPEDDDVKVAVMAKVNLFSPTKLLTELTGKDLTKIPLLKELVLNFAFAISNDDFVIIKNEEFNKAISGIIEGEKTIEKGTKLYLDLPVREMFKKLAPDLKTESFPASLFVKATINKDGVKFKFPDEWKSDLLQILKGLAPKLKEYIPKWLKGDGPPIVVINDFSFDYKTLAFAIDISMDGPFKLGKILSLYNISLKVSHKGEDKPYEFSFSSSQTLFGETLLVTKLSKKGGTYEFDGSISSISTGQLIKALGVKYLSEETMKKLSYLDFGMCDVKLKAKFGDTFFISFKATPILFGWDGLKVEGIMYEDGASPVMAMGISIEKIRLDEIVEKLFDKKLAGITWLTELNVVLTMSTTDATAKSKDLKFENPSMKEIGIKKGILFRAVAKIPTDCKGDQLCEVSKNVTSAEKKERSLIIEGKITLDGVELRGIYEGKWSIGKNVQIPKVELVLKIGKETKVYFQVNVNILEPKLELEGTVGIGGTGSLQLSAKMTGIWDEAFGIKFLSFGNLAASISIIPGVAVTDFAFEGELRLGYLPKQEESKRDKAASNQITSKAAVGIDGVNPANNYFYAQVSKFTLDAIVEAFGLNIQLPKALMDTGFPDGVIVSFTLSPKGKELKQLKTKIDNGFRFQGKIRILGFEVYVDCSIAYNPVKFSLLVEMSPIKIGGGLIALQKSKNEADKGPMLQASIAASAVKIKIKAFVTVLGISAGANIDVSDNGFEFAISGNLFDVVQADLKIKSKYADIKSASFHVSACIKTGPDVIQKAVKEDLTEAGKAATETMNEANEKVAGIGNLYLDSKEGVSKMDKEIDDFKAKLRKKGDGISEAKRILNEKCINQCSTECIGGPDWDPKCLEVGGGYVGCPVWNDCKFKAPNYECIAKCKGKKGFSLLKAKGKQVALEALLKIMEGLKKLFNIGKKFFDKSRKLLDTAKSVLGEAKEKLKAGLDAAKAAASTAIENIVQIHSMCFESGLDEAAKACVGLNINATFFKTKKVEFDTKGCLDVSFAKQIAQAISDKLYPGIKALKGAIGGLKSKFGIIETEKDNVEVAVEEAKAACKDGDSDSCEKATARDVIWSEEEHYYKKLAYEQLPRFTLRDDATLRLFDWDPPSMKAANDDPMAKAKIEKPKDVVQVYKKRESVTANNGDEPCLQFSKQMDILKGISDGMTALVSSQKRQNQRFKEFVKSKRNRINRIAVALKSQCLYYGCNKEQLGDAMFYVNKARKEMNKWERNVRSQLKSQDSLSFSTWKKQLDANVLHSKGYKLAKYVENVTSSSEEIEARMGIADNDSKMQMLRDFGKGFADLMDNEGSLSSSAPVISSLASKLAEIQSSSQACAQQR